MSLGFNFGGGDVLRKQVELAVEATGQQAIDEVVRSLESYERQMTTLQALYAAGRISAADLVEQVKSLAQAHGTETKALEGLMEAQDAFVRGFKSITEAREHDATVAKATTDEEKRLARELAEAERDALREREANIRESGRKRAQADREVNTEIEANIRESERRRVEADREINAEIEANIRESARRRVQAAKDYADEVARAWDREEEIENRRNQVVTRTGDAYDATQRRGRAAARATLEFSRGLEDLTTAGPIGMLNNIPTMFYNIGQALNWTSLQITAATAGVSIFATAIYAIYKNFDLIIGHDPAIRAFFKTLGEQLNPFHVERYTGALEKMEERIKEIKDAKIKVAVDTAELDVLQRKIAEAKKDHAAFEAQLHKQTDAERESGKRVEDILGTEGGREAFERETQARIRQFRLQVDQGPMGRELADLERQIAESRVNRTQISRHALDRAEQLRGEIGLAHYNAIKDAETQMGQLRRAATEGTGDAQRVANERLAAMFRGVPGGRTMDIRRVVGGPEDIGGQIEAAGAGAVREEQEHDEEIRALGVQKRNEEKEQKERDRINADKFKADEKIRNKEDQERQKRDRDAAREARQRGAATQKRIDQEVGKLAPRLTPLLGGFLTANAAILEMRRRLVASGRQGRQQVKEMDRQADRNRRDVVQAIRQRDRDRDFQRMRRTMTPEDKAMLNLQDQLRLQTRPLSPEGAESFAMGAAEHTFRTGGLGAEDVRAVGPREATMPGILSAEALKRAQVDQNARIQAEFARTGSMQAALESVHAQNTATFINIIHQQQAGIMRALNLGRMNNRGLNDLRQTQLNIGGN